MKERTKKYVTESCRNATPYCAAYTSGSNVIIQGDMPLCKYDFLTYTVTKPKALSLAFYAGYLVARLFDDLCYFHVGNLVAAAHYGKIFL